MKFSENSGQSAPRSLACGCELGVSPAAEPACLSLQVSVNGQHFLHYPYRLPLSRVDTLGIFGDILVKAVGFLNINVSSLGVKDWVAAASGCP